MSVLGIITEYNPFHNGHLHHLNESKKVTKSDFCVCIMSGNFIQRGEPALINKWARAKMAIQAGVDLIIELPVVYAVQSAELFAFGSIKLLDSLGVIDKVCFGSEAGSINDLDKISSVLANEPNEFKDLLKKFLKKGISFPAARSRALKEILDLDLDQILSSSNNILGIEYLKAIKRLRSSIMPYTITRISNNYNAKELTGEISSATSIRNCLFNNNDLNSIKQTVPKSTFDILSEEFFQGKGPIFTENFEREIFSTIRKMPLHEIKNTFDVEEGLENRIKKASMQTDNINNLIKLIKSKRYAQTRIQRILIHILLGIKKDIYAKLQQNEGPQYIRVLAFNEKGRQLLNTAKKKASLPIITRPHNFKKYDNNLLKKMLQYDITATNIYNLAYTNSQHKKGNIDFTTDVIYIKE